MRFLTIIVRRHNIHWILVLLTIEVVALRTITGPVGIPGRGDDAQWVLGPLLPALPALLVPAAATVTFQEFERVTPSPVRRRRLLVVATQLAVAALAAFVGLGLTASGLVALRNGLLVGGLALCASVLLPPMVSWSPVVIVATATWIVGVPALGDPVPSWALLLLPSSDHTAAAAASVLQLSGWLLLLSVDRPRWLEWGTH